MNRYRLNLLITFRSIRERMCLPKHKLEKVIIETMCESHNSQCQLIVAPTPSQVWMEGRSTCENI